MKTKTTTEKVLGVYKTLLKLYPNRFQDDYSEEMIIVFQNACNDSAKLSKWSIYKLGLRELRDLPINLIKEYMSEIWRGMMKTQDYSQEPWPKSILRGVISFSASFTLIWLIYCLIDTIINSGNSFWKGTSIWNTLDSLYLHPTALAYSFGAVIMGMKYGRCKAWLSALGAFLAFTLFNRIWDILSPEQINLIPTSLVPYILSTIFGILVGGVIGLIQQGWKKTGWYALAGLIGFNLGYVVDKNISFYLITHSPQGTDHLMVGDPWYFFYFLLPVIFYGGIVGICMGLTTFGVNKRTPIINQG